jgi:acetyl esterase/lipase
VIRYLREHAGELGIDPSRLVAAGGSAGGHLAAATAMLSGLDDPSDNLAVSCKPNALVLFNPVIDNGPEGYGYERTGERFREISPLHNISRGNPPTLFFLGTSDNLIPVSTAKAFQEKMRAEGNRCDLFLYEDQKHGFFNFRNDPENENKYFRITLRETHLFLLSMGYLKGNPTI